MVRYAMAVNIARCQGCQTCAMACKMNNNLPKSIWRNRLDMQDGQYVDTATGEFPGNLKKVWVPTSCQHCSMPVCLAVCPQNATFVHDNGIVDVDEALCIGCGTCVAACPYQARVLNPSEIEYYTDFPLGDSDAPVHVNGLVNKCDFCLHRLERGDMPACMEFCPGDCRHWGDLDDPESDVSKYLEGKTTTKLLESEGTEPNCFYIETF